jgi:predicted nucleic acid-binding protein
MPAAPEAFLDTNVLVYALAKDAPAKHAVAAALVERGFHEGCFAISTQVMLELFVTLTRKIAQPLAAGEARSFLAALATWPVVAADAALVLAAVDLAQRYKLSLWDAAIVEAARLAGCGVLYSEDLAAGATYAGVTVANPFAPPPEP